MNPELPRTHREELEIKITALLLGELDAAEAERVQQAIDADPKLGKLHEQLKQTLDLVAAASADRSDSSDASEPLHLSEDKRNALLTHFKEIKPAAFQRSKRPSSSIRLIEVAAVLAILAVAAAMLLPSLAKSKAKAQRVVALNEMRQRDLESRASDSEQVGDARWIGVLEGPAPAEEAGKEPALALFSATEKIPANKDQVTKLDVVLPSRYASSSRDNDSVSAFAYQRNQGIDNLRAGIPANEPVNTAAEFGQFKSAEVKDGSLAIVSDEALGIETGSGGRGITISGSLIAEPASVAQYDSYSRYRAIAPDFAPSAAQSPATPALATPPPPPNPNARYYAGTELKFTESPPFEDRLRERYAGGYAVNGIALPQQKAESTRQLWSGLDKNGRTDWGFAGQTREQQPTLGATVAKGTTLQEVPVLGDLPMTGRLMRSGTSDDSGTPAIGDGNVNPITGQNTDAFEDKLMVTERARTALGFGLPAGGIASSSDSTWQAGGGGGAGGVADENRTLNFFADNGGPAVLAGELAEQLHRGESVGDRLSTFGPGPAATTMPTSQREGGVYDVKVVGYASAPEQPHASGGTQPNSTVQSRVTTSVDHTPAESAAEYGKVTNALNSGFNQPDSVAVNEAVRRQADAIVLNQKKQELETLIGMRDTVQTRINQKSIDASLPKTEIVQIVDQAEPESSKGAGVLRNLGRAFGSEAQSVARIKLNTPRNDIQELGTRSVLNSYDPYFIQTEEEVIQSEAVLGKALQTLEDKRGRKMDVSDLRKSIDLKPVGNTSLLEIKAKSVDPQEAADIANAVAEAYTDYRKQTGRKVALGGIKELAEQREQLGERVNQLQSEVDALRELQDVGATMGADVAPPRQPSPEAPTPQPEVQTSDNAFSTFSLNVSDVSFKLAAASLEQGQMPDVATIRSEEFLNAFNYRDPAPAPGQPLAFAWERARYPFAHNRDLLRFSVQTAARGREPGRPLNLVLLLDNSGSMERSDRVRIIRECLNVLAGQLTAQDTISVVTFARTARLWLDGVPGVQAAASLATAGQLTPEGGTNLEEAMKLAYATAHRHYLPDGVNRVVLLTDGAANLGNIDPDSLKGEVEAQRKQGIALDCFGIGWEGYNDDVLEVLSRNGDGRYGFVNTPQDASREFASQLAGALQVAASDLKVQVEFNPERVTAYRQIGYAKHQLTQEQFRDNTVDAAEIGAAESGNALYVVETNPQGQGPLATVRARFKVPATGEYQEYKWTVPYSGEAVALESASPAMRLAATASAFSEWLVASPYAGEVTTDSLLKILGGAPEVFGADPRPTELEGMIREAGRIAGN